MGIRQIAKSIEELAAPGKAFMAQVQEIERAGQSIASVGITLGAGAAAWRKTMEDAAAPIRGLTRTCEAITEFFN